MYMYFLNVIYSCDGKAEFSASLLQSSVSHDPSEIILKQWFGAQEAFLIKNLENGYIYFISMKQWYILNDYLMNRKLKITLFILKRNRLSLYCHVQSM